MRSLKAVRLVDISSEMVDRLIAEARRQARDQAYCPYSGFAVGAAALTEREEIFGGCNVENASYGLTVCAERNAIFQATAQSGRPLRLRAVVIYTPTETPTAPCGACRQVMHEFGPTALIVSICDGAERLQTTVAELLPHAFGPCDVG